MDRVQPAAVNSAENIQVRRDDAPGATRQLVIDDVTFAESVLMYEVLDYIRDARMYGLEFVYGYARDAIDTVVVDGAHYKKIAGAAPEVGLNRDMSGQPVRPPILLRPVCLLEPEKDVHHIGCVVEEDATALEIFEQITGTLRQQSQNMDVRVDIRAKYIAVDRSTWKKLQDRFSCQNMYTTAEMLMRANPQIDKIYIVDDFENGDNVVVYR